MAGVMMDGTHGIDAVATPFGAVAKHPGARSSRPEARSPCPSTAHSGGRTVGAYPPRSLQRTSIRPTAFTFAQRSPKPGVTNDTDRLCRPEEGCPSSS